MPPAVAPSPKPREICDCWWRKHSPCLECTEPFQVNKSTDEADNSFAGEGIMNAKQKTLMLNEGPAKHSTRAELLPVLWCSAPLPSMYQALCSSPSTASSLHSLMDLSSASTCSHKHLMCHGPTKMLKRHFPLWLHSQHHCAVLSWFSWDHQFGEDSTKQTRWQGGSQTAPGWLYVHHPPPPLFFL